jgi:hypothetical protein
MHTAQSHTGTKITNRIERAKSNPKATTPTIRDEAASVTPVDIGGRGTVTRPAEARADLTPCVAIPPRGELRASGGRGGETRRSFIYRPQLTPRSDG